MCVSLYGNTVTRTRHPSSPTRCSPRSPRNARCKSSANFCRSTNRRPAAAARAVPAGALAPWGLSLAIVPGEVVETDSMVTPKTRAKATKKVQVGESAARAALTVGAETPEAAELAEAKFTLAAGTGCGMSCAACLCRTFSRVRR